MAEENNRFRDYRGFPFNIQPEDMSLIDIPDIYRTYQYLKMYLKRVLEKRQKRQVLEQIKNLFLINFNKKQYHPSYFGRQKGDVRKLIELNYLQSPKVKDLVSELLKLNYTPEEIHVRLLLDDLEPLKRKLKQQDQGQEQEQEQIDVKDKQENESD